jgi:hypothetical protein
MNSLAFLDHMDGVSFFLFIKYYILLILNLFVEWVLK